MTLFSATEAARYTVERAPDFGDQWMAALHEVIAEPSPVAADVLKAMLGILSCRRSTGK